MENIDLNIWLGIGTFLILSEFLLPGLVMVFIGMGSLTVALALYLGYIDSLLHQLITFFLSSIFYLLTIRFFVLRFVPTDSKKENVNEDEVVIGTIVEVVEDILIGQRGRVIHSDSSWPAKSNSEENILKGEKVKIVGRENITWIVQKI